MHNFVLYKYKIRYLLLVFILRKLDYMDNKKQSTTLHSTIWLRTPHFFHAIYVYTKGKVITFTYFFHSPRQLRPLNLFSNAVLYFVLHCNEEFILNRYYIERNLRNYNPWLNSSKYYDKRKMALIVRSQHLVSVNIEQNKSVAYVHNRLI